MPGNRGYDDVAEALHRVRAVDLRRFDLLVIHALQRGEVHHRRERETFPDRGDDQREQRGIRLRQPGRFFHA